MAKRTPRSQAVDGGTAASTTPGRNRSRATSNPPATFARGTEPAAEERSEANDTEARSNAVHAGPNDEEIRMRAYQRYVERGGGHGMDFDDWVEAERELKKRS